MTSFTPDEMAKVRDYLCRTFDNQNFILKMRDKASDSLEVLLKTEFIGVIYKDTEDGETSYDFNMAILSEDVE